MPAPPLPHLGQPSPPTRWAVKLPFPGRGKEAPGGGAASPSHVTSEQSQGRHPGQAPGTTFSHLLQVPGSPFSRASPSGGGGAEGKDLKAAAYVCVHVCVSFGGKKKLPQSYFHIPLTAADT